MGICGKARDILEARDVAKHCPMNGKLLWLKMSIQIVLRNSDLELTRQTINRQDNSVDLSNSD